MKTSLIAPLVFMLLVISCNEDVQKINDEQILGSEALGSIRKLSDTQIDSIAMLHNDYLALGLSGVDTNQPDLSSQVYNSFNAIGISDFSYYFDTSEINEYLAFGITTNHDSFVDANLSPNGLLIVDSARNFVNQLGHYTYNDLQAFVSNLCNTANSQLIGEELDAVLIML